MDKKLLFFVIFILSLTSCNEEVLDKAPLGNISDDVVWNDEILIDAYLTQAYSEIYVFVNEVPGSEDYNNSLWTRWSDINGIADEGRNQWASTVDPYKKGGLTVNGGLLEWWENSYIVIRKLNEFIQRVPESSLENEEFKMNRTAEARFLRAYNYFAMVKRYGGVPLITEPQSINDSKEELFPERNSEQEIYDFVISEVDAIANDLPEVNESGRPSKYAALALKSRAALYAGSIAKYGPVQLDGLLGMPESAANDYFQKSYNASLEVINSGQHALYDANADKTMNFREIFLVKNNAEAIFVRPHNFVDANSGGNGWSYDFFQSPLPNAWGGGNQDGPYLEMVEEFEYVDGISGKLDRDAIQQGLWTTEELWGNKDPRFFATIYTHGTPWQGSLIDWHNGIIQEDGTLQIDGSYNGIHAQGRQYNHIITKTSFGVMKYLDENKSNLQNRNASGTDWIVFRYGEILLNYAEAAMELGKSGEALSAVNSIRNRAGIAELSSIDMGKIRHERKVELAFEGHRYWDLRRWRTAVEKLTRNFSGLRYILDYESGKLKLEVLTPVDGAPSPTFYPYNYYLPITNARTGTNSNLVENPGYN